MIIIISDIMTEMSTSIINKKLEEMKESNPDQYDQTLKMFINSAKLAINFMKESPEFRNVFDKIHREFLNYPESKKTIKKAIEAGKKEIY